MDGRFAGSESPRHHHRVPQSPRHHQRLSQTLQGEPPRECERGADQPGETMMVYTPGAPSSSACSIAAGENVHVHVHVENVHVHVHVENVHVHVHGAESFERVSEEVRLHGPRNEETPG